MKKHFIYNKRFYSLVFEGIRIAVYKTNDAKRHIFYKEDLLTSNIY